MPKPLSFVAAFATLLLVTTSGNISSADEIRFKRTQLDGKFRSEGVAVGDFNSDGKLDVAAGSVYYAAPDWKMHSILEKPGEFEPQNYSNSFINFAEDLNGDGRTDLIVVGFPGEQTWWYEQPAAGEQGPWKQHLCTPVTNNESVQLVDLDGDGQRDLLMAVSPHADNPDSPERYMAFLKRMADPYKPWQILPVSVQGAPATTRYAHGLGAGDINSDGRLDILCPQGWWEAPTDRTQTPWTWHPAPFGSDCAHMYGYDFDGDGDTDVLNSSAHAAGIWWHEQTPDGWKTHEISNAFSQSHSLMLADINGDGLPDFVTGKRFWAHGPNGDVDPGAPAVLFWFELERKDGTAHWKPHKIDHDSGVGTQFEVADINGDGLLDIITSNKKGVYLFEQQR